MYKVRKVIEKENMENGNALNTIYDHLIENEFVKTSELNNLGYNSKKINELIENGILIRIKRGYYQLSNVDKFYNYGKKLIAQKQYERATKCFERCYQINPLHQSTCFQLFLRAVRSKQYDEALKYFNVIFSNDKEFYKQDANFYLYLMGNIVTLPEQYQNWVKSFSYEDIKVLDDDYRYPDIDDQNKMRLFAFDYKFPAAYEQLNYLTAKNKGTTVQNMVIKSLLQDIINIKRNNKNVLLDYINKSEYQKIIDYLDEKSKSQSLTIMEQCLMTLAEVALKVKTIKKVPIKRFCDSNNVFKAITSGNYELALQLCDSYNLDRNIDNSKSFLYLMLNDIVTLINSVRKKTNQQEEKSSTNKPKIKLEKRPIVLKPHIKAIKKDNFQKQNFNLSEISLLVISKYLAQQNYGKAIVFVRDYLESINKAEYEFLVINLIKLSLYEKDLSFKKVMEVLNSLTNNNFIFNAPIYIREFNSSLLGNRYGAAKICLDIISEASQLEEMSEFEEELKQLLDSGREIIDSNIDTMDTFEFEYAIEESNNIENTSKTNILENMDTINEATYNNENTPIINYSSEISFVYQKASAVLDTKGLVVFDLSSDQRRQVIADMLNEMPTINAFCIGEDPKQQVVLRYRENEVNSYDLRALLLEAADDYNSGKYNNAIEKYKYIMSILDEPEPYLYYRLGICYYKKGYKARAIDYLTIVQDLNIQQNNNTRDLRDFIAFLKGDILKMYRKPYFRMSLYDFENDIEKKYNVKHIKEISDMVIYNQMKIEEVCHQFGITSRTIPFVKLIIAEELYAVERDDEADELLAEVEKEQNKSMQVRFLLEEIKVNKRFYKYRKEDISTPETYEYIKK